MSVIKLDHSVKNDRFQKFIGKMSIYVDKTKQKKYKRKDFIYKLNEIYDIFGFEYKRKNIVQRFNSDDIINYVINGKKILFLKQHSFYSFMFNLSHPKANLFRKFVFNVLDNILDGKLVSFESTIEELKKELDETKQECERIDKMYVEEKTNSFEDRRELSAMREEKRMVPEGTYKKYSRFLVNKVIQGNKYHILVPDDECQEYEMTDIVVSKVVKKGMYSYEEIYTIDKKVKLNIDGYMTVMDVRELVDEANMDYLKNFGFCD